MSSFGKVVGYFMAFLLPLLFVYGVIRVSMLGFSVGSYGLVDTNADGLIDDINFSFGQFLPSWNAIVQKFSTFPSIRDYLQPAIDAMKNASDNMVKSQITDLVSFFTAVGSFFTMIWYFLVLAVDVMRYPFAVLGWVLTVLFIPSA